MTRFPTDHELVEQYHRQDALRHVVDEIDRHPSLSNWTGSYLPRPLFVDHREIVDFGTDVLRLFELITSLPQRLFDGDLQRYTSTLGIDEQRAKLITSLGGIKPPCYGRADMYHDGTSFKLLEIGIASEVGGADRAGEIPKALMENEAFAKFAADHGLGYTHTGREVAETLREAGRHLSDSPVVALLEGPGGLAGYAAHWNTFRDVMRGFGLDFHVAEVGDVRERDGKLYLGDTGIDVVLRCFTVEEIIGDADGFALVEPVLKAHREGGTVLFTPFESNLFANKGALGLLSDTRHRDRFTADELAVVDRVLPWTRSLKGAASLDDELVTYARDNREELILKPNGYYGGVGVVAGWDTDADTWWKTLKDGVEDGCVIQKRVIPRSEPVRDPQTGAVEPWQAAWGLFYTPRGYAGAYARAVPAFESPVIGVTAYKNTRTAGVFHYGEV
ncbi:hypothetical protein [Streptomyces hiroshimensis]|uniref:Circularly permuted type 2 ATP-grasp protein n=1 Tax=Streptomyces hiroshimensis TaxID=66424 RepID=A0ABQ2YT44_9ACTN|nr:hypothetical protein [Streptomyces hiroshimensis]GGX91959.1 hypothetical protein GCM10010324_42120 [Streptomyces hiroshimensis]